jgi:hypothetical protein
MDDEGSGQPRGKTIQVIRRRAQHTQAPIQCLQCCAELRRGWSPEKARPDQPARLLVEQLPGATRGVRGCHSMICFSPDGVYIGCPLHTVDKVMKKRLILTWNKTCSFYQL